MMTDEELLRYSRHILLPDIDIEGQQLLKAARVAIVGLGGLGSPVSLYLAAAGVGHLHLIDFDEVDHSNLQRQVVHTDERVGMNKAESAQSALTRLNPYIDVVVTKNRVADKQWSTILAHYDVVLDCTDNFETRFALNRACLHLQLPLISGAAIRMEGQLSVFDHRVTESPCYQCLYSPDASDDLRCAEAGVLSPIVGVIGSLQALETLKLITKTGDLLVGRLVLFDGKTHQWREMRLPKDPHCEACGHN